MKLLKILAGNVARRSLLATLALGVAWAVQASGTEGTKPLTTADVLSQSKPGDWRPLDADNTLYFNLAAGRVILELAPAFAPEHVANIKRLVRAGYFDGLAIIRAQDNYVVQWGDPDGTRANKDAGRTLPAEYFRALTPDLAFTRSPDGDVYAPEVGWSGDFPSARDPRRKQSWLAHCYGAIGVGRGNPPDTGSGAELYVVIGHAPRHLDRNLAVVGRVVQGMELLSALPRGSEALGFYAKPEQYASIKSVRVAADLPAAQRLDLETLRTDKSTWTAYVDSRRSRREDFFVEPTGHVELCNVSIPVRMHPLAENAKP